MNDLISIRKILEKRFPKYEWYVLSGSKKNDPIIFITLNKNAKLARAYVDLRTREIKIEKYDLAETVVERILITQ